MIDGVKLIELITYDDDRGFFREIFRFPEKFDNIAVGQLSHSLVKGDVIKAWHGHVYQSQWNYVVSGQIKVVLYDDRKESATYKETMVFVTEDDTEPLAYFFPPGVLHGYKCLKGPMQIIYVTSGVYDLDNEIRMTNEDLNIDFTW
jgi:dTDP-4-dehydrorhamnose 3,5-epimerase